MNWNATDIISLAAVVGAAVALINYTNRVFLWLHRNARQEEDLKAVKEEQRIMSIALSACLVQRRKEDGLQRERWKQALPGSLYCARQGKTLPLSKPLRALRIG